MMRFLARLAAPFVLVVLFAAAASPAPAAADPVLVFAAASLKNALDDAAAAFEKQAAGDVKISYAASSRSPSRSRAARRPIIFISADLDWMNYVAGKNLIKTGYAQQPARQPPRPDRAGRDEGRARDQAGLRARRRCSAAGGSRWPIPIPFRPGNTARRRCRNSASGTASSQRSRRPRTCARRCASSRAARRRSASSMRPTPRPSRTCASSRPFPQDSYPPIVYPAAIIATSKNPAAVKFLAYIRSAEARPFFEKQGFVLLSLAAPAAALADAQ